MSTTLDTFVMRRMQNAALNRWQQQAKQEPEEEEIHHYTEPRSRVTAEMSGIQQILSQLGDLDMSSSTLGDTSVHSSQHMRVRVSSSLSLMSLTEDEETEADEDDEPLFQGLTSTKPTSSLLGKPAVTVRKVDPAAQPTKETEEKKPEEPTPATPSSATACATAMAIGRPHVGPRQWNQRPVFHDVLDCDLLDDDDDDFFGTSTKNKTIRSTKTTVTPTAATNTHPGPRTTRGPGTKKKKKATSSRPNSPVAPALKTGRGPAVSTRSLSPTPVRRNKVMSLAA